MQFSNNSDSKNSLDETTANWPENASVSHCQCWRPRYTFYLVNVIGIAVRIKKFFTQKWPKQIHMRQTIVSSLWKEERYQFLLYFLIDFVTFPQKKLFYMITYCMEEFELYYKTPLASSYSYYGLSVYSIRIAVVCVIFGRSLDKSLSRALNIQ